MLKQKYVECLDEIKKICDNNDISDSIKVELVSLKDEVENFKMKIPLVGGFNAGKSSMINKYLGENILPEEITPETAIAAEIKYGANRIVAHGNDGRSTVYSIEDIKLLESKNFKYIEIFVDNERLRRLDEDLVIVDMPGFDSKLEDHNNAIIQYLDNGVAFILVIDSEDGCIKSSLLTFLYELSSYQLNFSVVVNKSDKKIPSELEAIVDTVKRTVNSINSDAIIGTSSIFNEDSADKFECILKNFDKQLILKKCFEERLLNICSRVLSSLNIMIKNSSVDIDDISRKINEIENKIVDLEYVMEVEEKNITCKLQSQTKIKILDDVKGALFSNSQTLANSMLEGEYVFKTRLNELLRPILINTTSTNLEPIFSGLLTNISQEISSIDNIALEVQGKLLQTSNALSGIEESFKAIQNNKEMFKNLEKYYKIGTTGLAVMTTVVAPWLELVIIFLPEILKLFGTIGENKKLEMAKSQLENEVIPNIIEKIRPEIEKSLETVKKEFMDDIKLDIEKRKNDLKDSLNQAISIKEMKEDEFKQYIESIEKDIEKLKEVIEIISRG